MLSGEEWSPHKIQGWTPDFIPEVLDPSVIDKLVTVTDEESMQVARDLATHEGIFCGISCGATMAGALKIAEDAPNGSTFCVMLPDTGERYLSTPLFDEISEDSDDEKDLIEAFRSGASGYLLKDMEPDDLVVALRDVLKGETIVAPNLVQILAKFHQGDDTEINITNLIATLTPRENEILELLAEGQSNKLIAKNLGISDGTVKLHVKSILRKLEIHSRVEAAVIAVEHGLKRKN